MPNALRQVFDDIADAEQQLSAEPRSGLIGIGEMAKRCETTYRTLRFYEAKGLLSPRREGPNRYYDEEAQRRFRMVSEGRRLGFTLTEIAKLLGASASRDQLLISLDMILDQIGHLEEQRLQVDAAIADLRRRYYLLSEPTEEQGLPSAEVVEID